MTVLIAGSALLPPAVEIPLALDELIYAVTSGALRDAGLTIDDVDGVCMAASDLNDGRAISTMTLTGSTGSFGKSEMRLCNDSLSAVLFGAAEITSGAADTVIVCTWSKLSDADPTTILPLALEPVFHRDLGYHPGAVLGLARSFANHAVTTTDGIRPEPRDTATALVLRRGSLAAGGAGGRVVRGVGASMGTYLRPIGGVLDPMAAAARSALGVAGQTAAEMSRVVVAGCHEESDEDLAAAIGVDAPRIVRQTDRQGDLGYAAGMVAVAELVQAGVTGASLVVSAGGLGLENAFAIVMGDA